MNFLLGKKLRLVFFGLILVLAIGFLVSQPDNLRYGNNDTLLNSNSDRNAQIKALGIINKRDSDNDGLKDWEEELWGTDSKNPDTDGDGTKDGEEVNLGRNPIVAGPDDKYQGDIFVKQIKSSPSQTELTETDKFAQEFFQNYISLRGSSKSLSENDKNDLINSSVSNLAKTYAPSNTYTKSDLNITQDTSASVVRDYGNTLGEIILKYSPDIEDELTIFNRSITNNDQKEIEKLDLIADSYNFILKDYLNTYVPKDVVDEHIALVNSIKTIAKSIENMRTIYNDPIRAIAGVSEHEHGATLLEEAIREIKLYFINKDIVFDKNETGFILINTI